MVRIIEVDDVRKLIQKLTLERFFRKTCDFLEADFLRWECFEKRPRIATYVPNGVIELMPTSDRQYYSFKYVNGHPKNPLNQKQTVTGFGALADVTCGYPLLIAEMTLLTAIRTAAVSALASKYLAPRDTNTFGIIGTGAQSEFQVLAHHLLHGATEIYYFDQDPAAMEKFENNLVSFNLSLNRCKHAKQVAEHSRIVTTTTANKRRNKIIDASWIKPGTHINAVGGDSPNKTELDHQLLDQSKVVVEHTEQALIEGEIQAGDAAKIHAELWEIICGNKSGRESATEITLFDSVGFAIEDFSILRLVYKLAEEHQIGSTLNMVAEPADPKNLYALLRQKT